MAGKSRYSTVAYVILGGSKIFASASRRASGTLVMPTRASMSPTRVASCTPVRIVNNDVLPTMGRPMIAVFMNFNCPRFARGSERDLDQGHDLLQNPLGGLGAA